MEFARRKKYGQYFKEKLAEILGDKEATLKSALSDKNTGSNTDHHSKINTVRNHNLNINKSQQTNSTHRSVRIA